MLGVNERRLAAHLLRLRDHVQRHGGLAARFRPKDFDHAAAREAADAERGVKTNRARGDHADRNENVAVAQANDRALAILLFDL